MDEDITVNPHDEIIIALGAIIEHDQQDILSVRGIINGSISPTIADLTAEQKLNLIKRVLDEQAIERQTLLERLQFASMLFEVS